MNARKSHFVLFLPFSLCLLFFIALLNYETPFRGEHWALLLTWISGNSWFEKLSHVINIEYFGDHRFQPLNFLPMILEYLVFKTSFFPYLLVSIVLHFFLCLGVARLLEILQNPSILPKWRFLLQKYPREISLFMVLFPGMEVLFWTYFHYIQIGTTLSVFSVGWFILNRDVSDRIKAYFCSALASLFYEPFLVVLGIFLIIGLRKQNPLKNQFFMTDIAFPFALSLAIGLQYLSPNVATPITMPPNVSVLNEILLQPGHENIFQAPGAFNKVFFLIYNEILLVLHLAMSTLIPAYANKTNLFEMMPLPSQWEVFLPLFSCVMIGTLLYFRKCFRSPHWLMLSIAATSFGTIVWGRPGAGHYASTQFRYGYIVLPFLFIVSVDLFRSMKLSAKTLSLVFGYLFTVNAASSLYHGVRLEKSFSTYSQFIEDKKQQGLVPDTIVRETTRAILDFTIPAPGHNAFLIYNGRGGVAKFLKNSSP